MIEMEKDSVNIRVSMAKSQPADRAERVECKKRSIYYASVFLPHPPFLSGKEEGGGKSEYVLNHLHKKKRSS